MGTRASIPTEWAEVPVAPGLLYEGARWLADPGVFQWVDIFGHAICRWNPYEQANAERRELPLEFVTVALPLSATRSIVASRNSVHEYDWASGDLRELAAINVADDIRFNDGGLSPTGDIYIGTMSMERRRDVAALYRLVGDELVEVLGGVTISNGLAWTSASEARYVDSMHPRVDSLSWRPDGLERAVFAVFDDAVEPDGLTIAPGGDVLVALWGAARLRRLSAPGDHIEDIPVPANFPTSVAIGGHDEELLLTTSADHEEGDVPRMPADGSVFVRCITPSPI